MAVTRTVVVAVVLAAAAAVALPASGAPRYETLRGRTAAGTPVAVTLRDGRVGRLTAGATTVRCADGWEVQGPAVSASVDGSAATGERATRYPDGSPGSLARVSATATRHGRTVTGELAYALTLYGAAGRVNRCAAGPVRFEARQGSESR